MFYDVILIPRLVLLLSFMGCLATTAKTIIIRGWAGNVMFLVFGGELLTPEN